MAIDMPPSVIQCQLFRQEDGNKYKIIIRCEHRPDIVLLDIDPNYKPPSFINLPAAPTR